MLQNLFSIRQFWLTKWIFLVYSAMRNAPYIHPSHDSILELWRTFPNECEQERLKHLSYSGPITLVAAKAIRWNDLTL